MTYPTQRLLFPFAKPLTRFEVESRKRGAPFEVSLKRQRGIRAQQLEHEAQKAAETAHVLDELMPRLGKIR